MEALLLGIDIGTSACKVAVFNKMGDVIASNSKTYTIYSPQEGWVEQDPNEWWQAVCEAIKEILETGKVQKEQIKGIGIDGQSWSAIPIDKNGYVLSNTPIWFDTRSQKICDRLNAKVGINNIFEVAGNTLRPSYSTAKIVWYKENKPEIYEKIHKILQSNAFIAYRLTGVHSHDLSQGYGMHCFDMKTMAWDEKMCELLDIPVDFLPPLYACHEIVGVITEKAARETGLMSGTPVVAGGLDAACGALGVGVVHAGETQEQGGQAGGMSICMDTYHADQRMILSPHVVPNRWLLQGGTTGGGGAMKWLESQFGDYERSQEELVNKSSFTQFNDCANNIVPGSEGVIFLPYMAGERSPIWDINAKGVYYGLDFNKTKGHFVRATMEGVAFSLKHNLEVAEVAGVKVESLRAMGGSANSLLWTQIKSDVTGKSIVVPSSDTATTLGAAILAGVGIGMYKSFEEAVKYTVKTTRVHKPNEQNKEVYDKNYRTYLKLYQNLKALMKENGGEG